MMDILKRAETALSAEHRSEYDVHSLRLLIAELMDEVSKLWSIGKELLDDQAEWITTQVTGRAAIAAKVRVNRRVGRLTPGKDWT